MIEIVATAQNFALVDGSPKFIYTKVLYCQAGTTFCAKSSDKHQVDFNKLEDILPIHLESFGPLLPSRCAIAPYPDQSYIKTPNLMAFDGGDDLANLVLQELATCEIIQRNPHKNLATYYGCQVSNGRITGLCFQKYRGTLLEMVNPDHLNKSMFIRSESRAAVRKEAAHYLRGIEAGIRHLYHLGRIHNDINPANIMISEDDTPVIIDFDTSSATGTKLGRAKRTYGWHDPSVGESREGNDFDALAELSVWLTGSSPVEFQFPS